ncbi:MAG: hypothetical protein GY865_19920 [candidate division Zixibacteria bacterium]|nr:hypothetical protein [candidate division Zixibacteria bacterium]
MYSDKNKTKTGNQSFRALLLIMITCIFIIPFIGNAEGGAGELPIEIPPVPTGEDQTAPDTTYSYPDDDSTN